MQRLRLKDNNNNPTSFGKILTLLYTIAFAIFTFLLWSEVIKQSIQRYKNRDHDPYCFKLGYYSKPERTQEFISALQISDTSRDLGALGKVQRIECQFVRAILRPNRDLTVHGEKCHPVFIY